MFLDLGGFFLFVLFGSIYNLGERRTGNHTAAMETGALSHDTGLCRPDVVERKKDNLCSKDLRLQWELRK